MIKAGGQRGGEMERRKEWGGMRLRRAVSAAKATNTFTGIDSAFQVHSDLCQLKY